MLLVNFILEHCIHSTSLPCGFWGFTKDHRVSFSWKTLRVKSSILHLPAGMLLYLLRININIMWCWWTKLISGDIWRSLKNDTFEAVPHSCSFTVAHLCCLCWHYSLQRASVLFFFLFLFGIQDLSRQIYYITVQFFHVHSGTVKNLRQQKST